MLTVVYDKQGNEHHCESVDAKELIASGHYFAEKPSAKAPVKERGGKSKS